MQRKIKIINIISFSLIFISLIAIFVFLKFPSLLNNSFQIKNVIIEGSEKSNISIGFFKFQGSHHYIQNTENHLVPIFDIFNIFEK